VKSNLANAYAFMRRRGKQMKYDSPDDSVDESPKKLSIAERNPREKEGNYRRP